MVQDPHIPASLRMGVIGGVLVAAAMAGSSPATGAVLVTSTHYEQNFDGLSAGGSTTNFGSADSGTAGWLCAVNSGRANTSYKAIERGSTAFSAQNTALDRYACVDGADIAYGARQCTGSGYAIGVFLRNASSAPITAVQISSVLELWRRPVPSPGAANPGWLEWGIGPGTMSETDLAPWAAASYVHSGTTSFRPLSTDPLYQTYTITGTLQDIGWDPGETLVLRWYFPSTFALNTMATTPVMALDDVRISFTGQALPEPGVALLGVSVFCTALTLRSRHRPAGAVCRRRRSRHYRR